MLFIFIVGIWNGNEKSNLEKRQDHESYATNLNYPLTLSPLPPDSHGLLWCRNRTDQTPTIPISSLRQSIRLPVSHESVVYLKGCAVRCYLSFEALDFRLFPILFSDADSGFGWPEVFIFCKPKQTLAEIFLILVFGNTDPRGAEAEFALLF